MKILHQYIVRTFIGPFIMVFAMVVFIFLMQFLWVYIDDLVGKDLGFWVLVKLLFYASVGLTSLSFPLSVLLASIMTLGSLGENYELIAMKASGISLQRIVKPLIVTSAVIGVIAFIFANYLTPYTQFKFRTLMYSIQQKRPELQIREGVFFDGIDNYSLRIGKRSYSGDMLYDIQIYDHTAANGNVALTIADSGRMHMTADKRFMELTLYDAESYTEVLDSRNRIQRTRPFRRDYYDIQTIRIALGDFSLQETDADLFKNGYQMLNLDQLRFMIDSLHGEITTHYTDLRDLVNPRYHLKQDSRKYKDTIVADIQAYFPTLAKTMRLQTIQKALDAARSVQNDAATGVMLTRTNIRSMRRYEIEYQRKLAMAFACFIFFFIGAPLGAIIRKGGMGMSIVMAVLFFVLYYVIGMVGEKSAREGLLTPFGGMWLAPFIILAVGILLTYKATQDAFVLSFDGVKKAWKQLLSKLFPQRPAVLPVVVLPDQLKCRDVTAALDHFNEKALPYLLKIPSWPRYRDMWLPREGTRLSDDDAMRTSLAAQYASLRQMLDAIHIDMSSMKYTTYPEVNFEVPRLQVRHRGQPTAYLLLFPLGLYHYLNMKIGWARLKEDLAEIIRVNRAVKQEVGELEWREEQETRS